MSDLSTLSYAELAAKIESLENGLASYSNQLRQIQDHMTGNDWFSDMIEKDEILERLCEILDINPTQTVSITATITVCATHEVPLKEISDFDADQFLSDNLSVDLYGGDSSLDDWSVDTADWEDQ